MAGQLAPYVRSVIEDGSYPNFAEVVITSDDLSYEQQFEFGLARLLDGIEAFVRQGRPTARPVDVRRLTNRPRLSS